MSGDYMGDEHKPKGEAMPDVNLSTIIERLEARAESDLPGDLITAKELAHALREILTVGGDVDRYLYGSKEAALMFAYGGTPTERASPLVTGPTITGRMTHLDPAPPQTMPRREATLTVGGEKPRVTVGGRDFEEGWAKMKKSIDLDLARLTNKRPAGILVSQDLANAIGEKLGVGVKLGRGESAALHYEGITVIVSEKIYGFGWRWIW